MGILKTLDGSRLIYLKPVHVFGRDPNVADYILTSDACSRMHCVIRWQGDHWVLTDESRNGCFVNGKQIETGSSVALREGDTLTVADDGDSQWVLFNGDCSLPVLVQLDASAYLELHPLNILPSEQQPECQIFKSGYGWVFETDKNSHPISEGSQVVINDKRWVFYPNHLLDETELRENAKSKTLTLEFDVSRNEEHVQLILGNGTEIFNLGHKSHHYLLLEMARYQLQDDIDNEKEKGWITNDLLLHDLKIDINNLNIQIYRARKSLRKFSEQLSQNLIERRRGELRLRPCNIIINQEGTYL